MVAKVFLIIFGIVNFYNCPAAPTVPLILIVTQAMDLLLPPENIREHCLHDKRKLAMRVFKMALSIAAYFWMKTLVDLNHDDVSAVNYCPGSMFNTTMLMNGLSLFCSFLIVIEFLLHLSFSRWVAPSLNNLIDKLLTDAGYCESSKKKPIRITSQRCQAENKCKTD